MVTKSPAPLPLITQQEIADSDASVVEQPRPDNVALKQASEGSETVLPELVARWSSHIRKLVSLPRSVFKARRGRVQLPRIVTHTVTFGCNARCVFCDSWQLSTTGDLSLEEIEGVYKQLPIMDAVRLTGGEPFMRKDLLEISNLAVRHLNPSVLLLSSNGFLTQRVVQFCEQRDRRVPLELAISLDGVDEFHNDVRGNSNAWTMAYRTVRALADRQRQLNLRLIVNQTVASDAGLDQYHRLHDVLAGLDVEHHLIIAYAESATYSLERERAISQADGYNSFAELDAQQLERTLDAANQHARNLPWQRRIARRFYLQGIRDRLLGQSSLQNPACQALHSNLRIFPNGDVPVCQFNSQVVGNFRRQSFQEIWSSIEAAEQRKWVRQCEGCWAECEVLPSALYTLEVLRPSVAKKE